MTQGDKHSSSKRPGSSRSALARIAASLLSADPLRLEEEALSVRKDGADLLHLDVMDGHFVPNLTFGPATAKRLAALGIPLDVHLMVDCLDWAVPLFVESLARSELPHDSTDSFCRPQHYVTIHAEVTPHLHRWLRYIREAGIKSGVALNPSTDPVFLEYMLEEIDLVLIMTVNPGWGGQGFIRQMVPKIAQVRKMIDARGLSVEIEVDGGVNALSARDVRNAGATILVAGSFVFGSSDRKRAIEELRR